MKLILYKKNDTQSIYEFDYARCGLNGWMFFYKNDWCHHIIEYDFLEGRAKVYSERESIYSYRTINNVRAIKIE